MENYSKGEGGVFLIIAIMLFVGVLNLQYGYYNILRVVVSVAALYVCIINISRNHSLQFIPLIIVILFNPIMPIYMSKGAWIVFDILTGIYFLSLWSTTK